MVSRWELSLEGAVPSIALPTGCLDTSATEERSGKSLVVVLEAVDLLRAVVLGHVALLFTVQVVLGTVTFCSCSCTTRANRRVKGAVYAIIGEL